MRLERDWGTCPHCGGPAVVTWLRTSSQRGRATHRSEVRMGSRCIDAGCPGAPADGPAATR